MDPVLRPSFFALRPRLPAIGLLSLVSALLVLPVLPLPAQEAAAEPAAPGRARRANAAPAERAVSRVIPDGDREILTFETAEDYAKLRQLFATSQQAKPAPGTFSVQYLRAHTDGSVQPYGLWVPKDYTGEQPFPVLIQLHGISPRTTSGTRPVWPAMVREHWIDEHTPVIIAQPLGRTNASYQGMGERDVMEVLREVQRRFKVDPRRVFIMGHSMGGAGAYKVGLHYPDVFGSITPIDPAMGPSTGRGGETTLPDWAKPQADITSAAKLPYNARNQSVYFKLAGAGIGGRGATDHAKDIVDQGGFATSETFPGMPHHFAPQRSYGMFVPQAIQQPIPAAPAVVQFWTNTLRYNRAYWATIDRLGRHNSDARLKATFDDGKPAPRRPNQPAPAEPAAVRPASLTVETDNITGLTLRTGQVVPKGTALPLVVDGQEVLNGDPGDVIHLSRTGGKWQRVTAPALAGKRHGVQGPIGDAFNTPFLAVYGDAPADRELAIAELDDIRNPGAGRMSIAGDFPMKAAAKVTADDIKNYSLILFGSPESNPVLKRLAPQLPAALMQGPHDGRNGVVFIAPNPENPKRYVVVWTARLFTVPGPSLVGGQQPLQTLPDYAIVRDGKLSAAGFLNNDWTFPN